MNFLKRFLLFVVVDFVTSFLLLLSFKTIDIVGVITLIILLTVFYMILCFKNNYDNIWFLPLSHLVIFIGAKASVGDGATLTLILYQFTRVKIVPSIIASFIYFYLVKKDKLIG